MATFRPPSLGDNSVVSWHSDFDQKRGENCRYNMSDSQDDPADNLFDQQLSNQFTSASSDSQEETYLSESEYTDDEESCDDRQSWSLKLPIFGEIALRRAFKRGKDPYNIQRIQECQLRHEWAIKFGSLRNIDTSFRAVHFNLNMQHHGRMARINDGEPISPRSLPRVEQMSLHEYEEAFGEISCGYESDVDQGDSESAQTEYGSEYSFDILDYTEVPRFSAPSAEGMFGFNPFADHPSSASMPGRDSKTGW